MTGDGDAMAGGRNSGCSRIPASALNGKSSGSGDDRQDFLCKRGFSKAETGRIVETVLAEEGRPPESVFDFVQGITAVARSKPQQDARLVMEGKAKALLEKAR
jgi:hypothetical protein